MYKETLSNPSRSPLTTGEENAHPKCSWLPERDILSKFGDRRTRAILAIMAARRSSGREKFFVPPQIAELFALTPRDLN